MGRKFGTGRRLGSTAKWGKLLPVMAAELLLSKGRRRTARLVSLSDLDALRETYVGEIPSPNPPALTQATSVAPTFCMSRVIIPRVQIKEQSPL